MDRRLIKAGKRMPAVKSARFMKLFFPFYAEQKYESCRVQASWYYIQLLNDMMCLSPSLCIVFFNFLGDLKPLSELTKRTAAGMPGSCGSFGRCP